MNFEKLHKMWIERKDRKILSEIENRIGYSIFSPCDIRINRETGYIESLSVDNKDIRDCSLLTFLQELPCISTLKIIRSKMNNLSFLKNISSLTILDLWYNQINDLSPLANLVKLTTLNLGHNPISDISPLANLSELITLKLNNDSPGLGSYPTITNISSMRGLSNLIFLDLSAHKITDISPLSSLSKLTTLRLEGSPISDICVLKALLQLTELDLSYTQISDISTLAFLLELTHLRLYGNQIKDIRPLANLSKLTELWLNHNQITDISALAGLSKLTTLGLYNNQIVDISPLAGLSNLTMLNLRDNQITDISKVVTLTKFAKLCVENNQITHVPREFIENNVTIGWEKSPNSSFSGINLYGNPLENPPIEIVKQGREAMAAYFLALETTAESVEEEIFEERQALYEVKILFVGDGGAGKTSLVKRLFGKPYDGDEGQTQGIVIKDATLKRQETNIKAHFWDFGGQEIMHATHQFFFSKRSVYVLVLDSRREQKADYWLKYIASCGGDAPVLVVINKIDENPHFDLPQAALQQQYPQIQGFSRVSCKTGAGIEAFRAGLHKLIADYTNRLRILWPQRWLNVKTELEQRTEDFVNHDAFHALCEQHGVTSAAQQDTLMEFLHDLGVALHFKEFALHDTHILNPRWLTNAVYAIITAPQAAANHGVVNLRDLDAIFRQRPDQKYRYANSQHRYIIEVMKKFELCFDFAPDTILLPDLLPVQEPRFDFDYAAALKCHLTYDFLPQAVMTRLLVKLHQDITGNLRWRTGVALTNAAFRTTAVVKVSGPNTLAIWVNGLLRREYLSVLRHTLNEINRSYAKLTVTEQIPCVCATCRASASPSFYPYDKLTQRLTKGKQEIECPHSETDVAIAAILDGVQHTAANSEEEMLQILRALKEKTDTEDTLLSKITDIIEVKPSLFGVTVDIGKLIKKALGKK